MSRFASFNMFALLPINNALEEATLRKMGLAIICNSHILIGTLRKRCTRNVSKAVGLEPLGKW